MSHRAASGACGAELKALDDSSDVAPNAEAEGPASTAQTAPTTMLVRDLSRLLPNRTMTAWLAKCDDSNCQARVLPCRDLRRDNMVSDYRVRRYIRPVLACDRAKDPI